jgi:hypothetical protein
VPWLAELPIFKMALLITDVKNFLVVAVLGSFAVLRLPTFRDIVPKLR